MGKSLKARFNGNSQEVVEYARNFGILRAMDHYGVKDYLAMVKFLEETAPSQHFEIARHDPDSFGRPDAFDKLLEAMLRKYSALETRIAKQDAENHELKTELDYYKAIRWREASGPVQAVLKECREGGET